MNEFNLHSRPVESLVARQPTSDGVVIEATQASQVLLIAGRPLNEPIVQCGPFVMNTEAQIHQAIHDLRTGRLA